MKTKTKYLCDLCEYEYSTPHEAEFCEKKGLPAQTGDIREGDAIEYTKEFRDDPLSAILSYAKAKGVVLFKVTSLNDKTKAHQEILFVRDGEEERGVIAVNIEGTGETLMSPATQRFKPGFAEALKTNKR